MSGPPDYLRTPGEVCKPDVRSPKTRFPTQEPLTVEYQYGHVETIKLHEGVPEGVRIQFETAKNLYLYAWFVFRFYPVAELHAYTCLELALRERFEAEMIAAGEKEREFGPGLKRLLEYAVKNKYLQNENFSEWQMRTEQRAKNRTEMELLRKAQEQGLKEYVIHEDQYEIKDIDRDHEYIENLVESRPWLRNLYAHGTSSLDKKALGTIQLVAEIINQIFPAHPS